MDYYSPPNGAERALRSRIRRCYIALAELQPAVESLYNNTAHLNEDYTVEDVNRMYEMYQEAIRALTDVADPNMLNETSGVKGAQERLLAHPLIADSIQDSIERVHYGAKSVIRNIEYQLDAGHLAPTDDIYQTIRETATSVLGLTTVILDAIDTGFIIDARTFKETGAR